MLIVGSSQTTNKDSSSANMLYADGDDIYERQQEPKVVDTGKRSVQRKNISYNATSDYEKQPPPCSSNYVFNNRDDSGQDSGLDKEKSDAKSAFSGSSNQKTYSMPSSVDTKETVQKVSPPRRKLSKKKDQKRLVTDRRRIMVMKNLSEAVGQKEMSKPEQLHDENVNEILEEEEALIAAHRKEIEDTM
ncbi:hypothetical protein Tco_0882246 [Tanacetum coccineum]